MAMIVTASSFIIIYEQEKMLYLRHYEFTNKKPNTVIVTPPDEEYEQDERNKIEKEINRQQVITKWVNKAKEQLVSQKQLLLEELMNTIWAEEQDLSVAYGVASEVIAFVSEVSDVQIDILQQLTTLQQNDFALWKTKVRT